MKRSKQTSHVSFKKTPFPRRTKRKIPLREWFLNPDYYEYYEDSWEDIFKALETK